VPGRFQAAVEMLVEMVDSQAKGVIHNAQSRKVIAPMALTVFVWIFMMNFMDMIPVDLFPQIWHVAGPAMGFPDYLRVVPTADLSTTLGLSLSVLLMCLYYNIKIKGPGRLDARAGNRPLWHLQESCLGTAAGRDQLPDANDRVRGEDGFARHAVVWQHVRG
jgi:F0F1-type ATP synthase membrane subunit a